MRSPFSENSKAKREILEGNSLAGGPIVQPLEILDLKCLNCLP